MDQKGFEIGEWIDRQHGIKIHVLATPWTKQQA